MLTESDVDRIVATTIDDYIRYLDPALSLQMKIQEEDFVEWRSEGPYIWDIRGRRYLDAGTAGGVFGLGHRHPRVVQAVKDQLDRMPQPSRMGLNPPQAQLAHRLADLTPGELTFSFISTSGTEAVEAALKAARFTTKRPQIISCLNSFHGMSIAASSVSGLAYFREGFNPLLGECVQVPFGDAEAIRQLISDRTAAVLIEPIQASSGCTVPWDGFLGAVRQLCDQSGALLIADEIQTALGRTGALFAVNHEDIKPDILCLGKILGGGVMPIGCAIYTPRIQQALAVRPLFNNSTFGGNQLACAAAVAALDAIVEDGLVERSQRLAVRFNDHLERLAAKYPTVVAGLKGKGLMRCLVLADPRQMIVLSPILQSKHRVITISPMNQPQLMRINPPLICEDEHMDQIAAALDDACGEASKYSPQDLDRLLAELRAKLAS